MCLIKLLISLLVILVLITVALLYIHYEGERMAHTYRDAWCEIRVIRNSIDNYYAMEKRYPNSDSLKYQLGSIDFSDYNTKQDGLVKSFKERWGDNICYGPDGSDFEKYLYSTNIRRLVGGNKGKVEVLHFDNGEVKVFYVELNANNCSGLY